MNERPLRVMHLITGLSVGGAETMLGKLLAASDRHTLSQSVVSLSPGGEVRARIEALGIRVDDLGMARGLPDPRGLMRLVGLLWRDRPDVLQTWLYHADFMGLVASRLVSRPALIWNLRCSDMGSNYYRGMTGIMVKALARCSRAPDAITTNSYAGRDMHTAMGYQPKRWEIIANGFDLNAYKPDEVARRKVRAEIGIPDEAIAIGLIARFDPVKGHSVFLEAANKILKQRSDVHFVLAGSGVEAGSPAFRAAISGQPSDQFHFLGQRSDVAEINAALDIAVSASLSEGFPNTLGEAMASGLFCVVTDVGDCREVLGDAGLVVPPGRADELADAMTKAINLPGGALKTTGAVARQRIKNRYSISHAVERHESLYRSVVLGSKSKPEGA